MRRSSEPAHAPSPRRHASRCMERGVPATPARPSRSPPTAVREDRASACREELAARPFLTCFYRPIRSASPHVPQLVTGPGCVGRGPAALAAPWAEAGVRGKGKKLSPTLAHTAHAGAVFSRPRTKGPLTGLARGSRVVGPSWPRPRGGEGLAPGVSQPVNSPAPCGGREREAVNTRKLQASSLAGRPSGGWACSGDVEGPGKTPAGARGHLRVPATKALVTKKKTSFPSGFT